ncbi:glycoside hydrolase family 128 protein [Aaosphaeria arxii CBS 175.79]|uniref:Glycoside hydrolase family 128 protein n=1 Tax=Aaosphaeria arxii CBS 175.79 TaxID=1450172 RepID=A0A6A5XQ36_9PLEO|nr:glycoside hydrolase family 128 protein [Aaosphaeria arxii CBS 175.79]KAF2015368.1 glycoside hydrolase family 128 protein [Aaosphaeria arxii CBS 175.79]
MISSIFLFTVLEALTLVDARVHGNDHTHHARANSAGKRGLAFNDAGLTKLFESNKKFSWMYNWGQTVTDAAKFDYVPMLHSNKTEHTETWEANLKTSVDAGATHVFSFNEPDQCGEESGGACMQDIDLTVDTHKKYIQKLAEEYPKLKLGAPAVTNGVEDEITKAKMGIPFLKEFLSKCDGCKIDFLNAHWYSPPDVKAFQQHLVNVYAANENKTAIWVTEFGVTGDPAQKTGEPAQQFLKEVLPWMDEQDWIERYAYQWVAPDSLVTADGQQLSPLGEVYATT